MDKRFYKMVNGLKVFNKPSMNINGVIVINPTEEQLIEAGYQEMSAEDIEKENLENELKELKHLLAIEDYKIIKCAEAFMSSVELPYDLEELIEVRNNRRNRINEIEELLK